MGRVGRATTGGKCNACGSLIAWAKVGGVYRLHDPKRDEYGNPTMRTVRQNGRDVLQREAEALHNCSGVTAGVPNGGHTETSKATTTHAIGATEDVERLVRGTMKTILDELGVKPPPRVIEVKQSGEVTGRVEGLSHSCMPRLLQLMARRRHSYLYGPAGTGKTHAAIQAAGALNLTASVMTMPGIQSPTRLFGFEDAQGRYVPTVFAERWRNGGVLIADELDRIIPQVGASLNSALENGYVVLGGECVPCHPDFVLVGTGNTDLRGATIDYTAAMPQDYALAARFAFVHWPIDEDVERELAAHHLPSAQAVALQRYMSALRSACRALSVDKVLCGPRETMRIAEDVSHGASYNEAFASFVRRGLEDELWSSLVDRVRDHHGLEGFFGANASRAIEG